VGYRVVVRRIVGIRGNRPLFSDALGELVGYDADGVTLATRQGPRRIRHDEIHRAKRVPRSIAEITALEYAANLAWPAPVQERLGDWILRAAGGWTGRANSALPLGNPGTDREAAIAAVQRWYADRDLPARINVPLPVCAGIDAALTARGWAASPPTLVLTAPVATVLAAAPARADLPPVRLAERPDDGWLEIVAARKGDLPAEAMHVLTAAPAVRFAVAGDHLAVARGAAADGFLQLGLLEVAEPARRQGLARHVTRALAEWGRSTGAGTAFLQVESGNAAALALYGSLGFKPHHEYVTRTAY
jgi:GNAT superfamily N-acetyltransferase